MPRRRTKTDVCRPAGGCLSALVTFAAVRTIQYTIGITGGSGSGKSYLIKSLRNQFAENELAILSQDNYYRPRAEQEYDSNGVQNFDLPTSFLMEDFERDLQLILSGRTVTRQEYTYNNAEAVTGELVLHPAPVLIVEGLFILNVPSVRESLDLKVFVDANDVMKVKRRILRDRVERNYPLEDVLYRYEHHVLPAYNLHIAPYRDHADVILNNNTTMDRSVELIAGFIRGMLG